MGGIMERAKPHKKLTLWTKVIDFVVFVYEITKEFPREEEFGLKAQLRRAAVSVPSNISEGLARRTDRDKVRFLVQARGSLSEMDTQLEISGRLSFGDKTTLANVFDSLTEVEMLLSGMIR